MLRKRGGRAEERLSTGNKPNTVLLVLGTFSLEGKTADSRGMERGREQNSFCGKKEMR